MAWTDSRIFREWIACSLGPADGFTGRWDPTAGPGLVTGDYRVALFDDTVTPDETVLLPGTAYGAGVWAGGEVTDTSGNGNWPAGGTPLLNVTYADAGQAVVFTADPAGGPTVGVVTIDGAEGDLLYFTDASGVAAGGTPLLADQGAAFHSFGGPQSVTAGFFTVRWNTQGVMLVTI
jgi:hypothetical protein